MKCENVKYHPDQAFNQEEERADQLESELWSALFRTAIDVNLGSQSDFSRKRPSNDYASTAPEKSPKVLSVIKLTRELFLQNDPRQI